jgi:hypothetical protein
MEHLKQEATTNLEVFHDPSIQFSVLCCGSELVAMLLTDVGHYSTVTGPQVILRATAYCAIGVLRS